MSLAQQWSSELPKVAAMKPRTEEVPVVHRVDPRAATEVRMAEEVRMELLAEVLVLVSDALSGSYQV